MATTVITAMIPIIFLMPVFFSIFVLIKSHVQITWLFGFMLYYEM